MASPSPLKVLQTGVPDLDAILGGGLPKGSVVVIGGAPGSGKTILAQQIGFHNARPDETVSFLQTLSEPTVKTLFYLQQFTYFDAAKLDSAVKFIDLGVILRTKGLEVASNLITEHIKKEKPSLVVIDSFRVFDDMAGSQDELRKFSYQLAVNLIAWECTALLLGEFGPNDFETNPLFSVIDALIMTTQEEVSGEQQRFIQVIKMRGAAHHRDKHPFVINASGIEVFAPRVTLRRNPAIENVITDRQRSKTDVAAVDELLEEGIPRGSSVLVAGRTGTGKTLLLLEFLYRGAKDHNEKGIFISFEETEEHLMATAQNFGWDLKREVERGMIELLCVAQPEILVESNLLQVQKRVNARKVSRIAFDSLSGFLYKVSNPQIAREKVYQIATIVQNAGALGLFALDAPASGEQLSSFGIEEAQLDGVVVLSTQLQDRVRSRYIEIYKVRNTRHKLGQFALEIKKGAVALKAD